MTIPTQEQIDKLFFESGRLSTEHFIKLIWKQAQTEERKRILEMIKKKIFGYDSSDGTHDFSSSLVLKVLKELKAQINSEDKNG